MLAWCLWCALSASAAWAQAPAPDATPTPEAAPAPDAPSPAVIVSETTAPQPEFGPVVRTFLAYLDDEQEVVDDRNSRHEISLAFYRLNTHRIRALRIMAVRLARDSGNDFLPELAAVAGNELPTIFLQPPKLRDLRVGQVYRNTYRYLGTAMSGGLRFHIFARLDQYEQEELMHATASPPEP